MSIGPRLFESLGLAWKMKPVPSCLQTNRRPLSTSRANLPRRGSDGRCRRRGVLTHLRTRKRARPLISMDDATDEALAWRVKRGEREDGSGEAKADAFAEQERIEHFRWGWSVRFHGISDNGPEAR